MALDAKRGPKSLEKVRVPLAIHDSLDTFLGDLNLRILEAATRRASMRAPDAESPIVSGDDVLQIAATMFAEASPELEQVLREHATRRVRNAS